MVKHAPATEPASKTLPADGMSRWNQIAPFSPFSREKFRQLVIAGKAPQPVKFSERCTAYQNRELHRFFADPLNYIATPSHATSAR
jgi:prophage regulatory protein